MTVRFLSIAEAELASATHYYEQQVPGLGTDVLDEVGAAIGKIRDFPEAWTPVSTSLRRFRLRRFPYGLIYEICIYTGIQTTGRKISNGPTRSVQATDPSLTYTF